MSSPAPDRKALEELWLNRLNDAKLRVDFARNYVIEVEHDFLAPDLPGADGNVAYGRARRAENLALSEYNHILGIVGALVLRGVIPDETDWLKSLIRA